MAKNMPSNTVPKAMVVRNEFFSEGMAKPDTGTVPSTFTHATEGASHHISGRCEENKDNDDENLSDTSDAAAENIQTIDIGPGEFDTYAIAYICKEQTLRMKKAVEETKNKPFQATKTAPDNTNNDNDTETSVFNANDSNMHTQAIDPNPMYTQNMNPQPMDAENDVNPNPMYLQSTTEPIASAGPARNTNPMYTHNATNTSPTHSRNDVNPNPMYLQGSPGPTFKSNKSDDNSCTQTSADAHQQAFSRPATNNDDNHCLQPYAVARYQEDDEAASLKIPGDNKDHPCIQPYAVTHHEHDNIAIESGKCGVVQPYAVQYEEDETFGESANNENNPCIQPYAFTHREDQEPSLNCDGGQPYAARYQEDDDSGSAASKNRHTASIASGDEVIQPYAAAYMCQGDVGWNTTSGDPQTSQNQNQPTAASNSINDVSTSPSSNNVLHARDPNPMYAAADMVRGDAGWNTTSGDTQASLSSQNLPAVASNSINDADDVLHALNPNPMHVPNVQHPAAHGTNFINFINLLLERKLGIFIVIGNVSFLFYTPTESISLVDTTP
ncbi:hypothetical protein Bbelb_037020 [Branchiostoma belcheri]|nr:hypothetical protein Bbelb_037020 [Branchiostoma belcheri]